MQLEQVLIIEKQRVKAQENKIIQLQENLGFIQVQLESNFNSLNQSCLIIFKIFFYFRFQFKVY
jgi:hypothetical protein